METTSSRNDNNNNISTDPMTTAPAMPPSTITATTTTTPARQQQNNDETTTDAGASHRQRPSSTKTSLNSDDEDEEPQGNVAIHYSSARKIKQTTPSSWADGGGGGRRRYDRQHHQLTQQQLQFQTVRDNLDIHSYKSAPPPRTKTPIINNLSNNTVTGETAEGGPRHSSDYYDDDAFSSVPGLYTTMNDGRPQPTAAKNSTTAGPTSFRGWLAEGIVDVLNAAAGVTLSTTATILSPPIALTRDVVLPAVLAIIVDTLDNVTPTIVQDWFRIITSSMYHLISVLRSTHQGKVFRKQLLLVVQNFFEALSAPEARQVVVDTMATGIKLADALHTPEMKIFLEQLGVLGCRCVDALASGKVKQLIQNGEQLAWQGIELAVDPATTMALAEVTAHLCHALEELGDSYHPTPRSVRNQQNEATYVGPLQITDYRSESIENVILSSLGIPDSDDDLCRDMADDGSISSVPSNVAYIQDQPTGLGSHDKKQNEKKDWTHCKHKVDVELLKDRIVQRGRPKARPNLSQAMRDTPMATSRLSSSTNSVENADNFPDPCRTLRPQANEDDSRAPPLPQDMEEVPLSNVLEFDSPAATFDINNPNWHELFRKMDENRAQQEKDPSSLQFYRVIYDTLLERRREKRRARDSLDSNRHGSAAAETEANDGWSKQLTKAHVRKFRNGRVESRRISSRAVNEKYLGLRRLWHYPPAFLYLNAALLILVICLWAGFGLYGMFTAYQHIKYQGSSPTDWLRPVQMERPRFENLVSSTGGADPHVIADQPPREVIIRIVKEVIHVREDGTKIEHFNSDQVEERREKESLLGLTEEEIDKMLVEKSNDLCAEALKDSVSETLKDPTPEEITHVSSSDMQEQTEESEEDGLVQEIINKLLYRCIV